MMVIVAMLAVAMLAYFVMGLVTNREDRDWLSKLSAGEKAGAVFLFVVAPLGVLWVALDSIHQGAWVGPPAAAVRLLACLAPEREI